MKLLMAFLAGAIAGAAAALMLAPKSGSELRTQMIEEAERDRERFRQGYESASQKTQSGYEKVAQKMHIHKTEEILDEEGNVEEVVEVDIDVDTVPEE